MNVFDANCTLGRHLWLRERGRPAAADLPDEMDHDGVGLVGGIRSPRNGATTSPEENPHKGIS